MSIIVAFKEQILQISASSFRDLMLKRNYLQERGFIMFAITVTTDLNILDIYLTHC